MATDIEIHIKERVNTLLHVYHTVAVHYADLHDTPERMLEKGCINEIVAWRESRSWFYWRLRRVVLQSQLIKEILKAQSNLQFDEAKSMLNRWFLEERGASETHVWWEQNKEVVEWMEKQDSAGSIVNMNLNAVRKDAVISQVDNVLKVRWMSFLKISVLIKHIFLAGLPRRCSRLGDQNLRNTFGRPSERCRSEIGRARVNPKRRWIQLIT